MINYQTTFEQLTASVTPESNEILKVALNKANDHFIITFQNHFERFSADGQREVTACSPSHTTRKYANRFLDKSELNSRWPEVKYSVGCTDLNALVISAWPLKQLRCEADAFSKIRNLKNDFRQQKQAANIVANYKERGIVPNRSVTINEKYPLSKYQKVAVHAAMSAGNYALLMEQGTGKTAPTIARICNEAVAKKGMYFSVVVCPKNVKYNWKREVEKFATCQGSVSIVDGSEMKRGKQILEAILRPTPGDKFTVLVMNYESVKSCMEYFAMAKAMLKDLYGIEIDKLFDLAILDESHYIKTPGAVRSKAAHDLRDISKSRMVLTGTPITNNPFDLYMQLEFLEQGMSGFGSFSKFKTMYGVFEAGGEGFEKLVGLQNIPLLKERLARVSFQIRLKEALPNLPEVVNDVYEVQMTAKQERAYIELATKMVAEIEQVTAHSTTNREVEAQHILTKLLRLAQVTSGYVGTPAELDENGKVVAPASEISLGPNPKIDALLDILRDKGKDEKTIIWGVFVHDVKAIGEALTEAGIKNVTYYGGTSDKDREAAVKAFNEDPECKVFVGNPAAASTGLNLLGYCPERPDDFTTNCTQIIHFSRNWSADKRLQADKRAHRRGTRVNVKVTDLIVPNTIDVMIMQRVEQKIEMGKDVQDVSEILKSIASDLLDLAA